MKQRNGKLITMISFGFAFVSLLGGNGLGRQRPSASNGTGKIVFDVDLTKGNAGPGQVFGGLWEKGWRVTGADNERIVFDAGYPVESGYLEVSFTATQLLVSEAGRKINYFGLHEEASLSQNSHEGDILYARTGNKNYKFSKIKAAGKKFDQNEWEQSVGELSDWITDDKTVHTIRLEWGGGLATFHDTKGTKYSCTQDTTCGGSHPIDKLRYVFLGSDKYNGFTPKGVRFLRAKLVDNSAKG